MAGAIRVLRLGWVTDFISRPVIVGFSFGLGLTVLVGDLPHLLGLPTSSAHALQRLWTTLSQLDQTNLVTLAMGTIGLAVLFIGGAHLPAVPWALVVMVVGVLLAQVWGCPGA